MDINKDNAMALLEAMLADSAADFEGGVLAYLDAVKAERKAINSFKRSCTILAKARERKYNALMVVIPEYGFLTGKEEIKPEINGDAAVIQLLMNIVEELDNDMYSEVADLFIDKSEVIDKK